MEMMKDADTVRLCRLTCRVCGGVRVVAVRADDPTIPAHRRDCPYLAACADGAAMEYERRNGDPVLVEVLE